MFISAQADIEDIIWEVDDDCDKAVSWSEFQAMFTRCRNDKTGALADPCKYIFNFLHIYGPYLDL